MKPEVLSALGVAVTLGACGGGSAANRAGDPPAHRTTRVPVEETEPDDGVEVVSSRGRMDPVVIEAAIQPHAGELTECYTSRIAGRRWLGGHVSLHWEVERDGTVTAVRLAESDLGAWPVEKCLLEIARAATFGKPIGGPADFSVPLDFTATGRLVRWDDDQALRAVGGQLVTLDECGKHKDVKGGSPSGVAITVYVGAQGKAQSVGFASARSVLEDTWAECAEKAALAWRLPDPGGKIAKLVIQYR